jgi:hypothetical protein
MPLAIREQQQSTAANTDFVFTLGAGTQVGDLVVVIQVNNFYTAANLTTPTGTAVSSWTLRHTMDGGTNDCHVKVWTGAVSTGGAQTVDTNWTTTDEERFVAVFVISGGAAYADAQSADTDTTSTNFVAPSVTPAAGSTDNVLLCAWGHQGGGDINLTVPGSMTAYTEVDYVTTCTYRAASEAYASSSVTGTRTATGSAARDGFGVAVIVSASTTTTIDAPLWSRSPGLSFAPGRSFPPPWLGTDSATAATLTGDAVLVATATITTDGAVTALTGATLAATATVSPAGSLTLATGATLASTATVTTAGTRWGPPLGLIATPISDTQIDLSWSAVAGASGYDIDRNGVVIATDVVGTTYGDTGLNPGTTYTYRARSIRS